MFYFHLQEKKDIADTDYHIQNQLHSRYRMVNFKRLSLK